MNRRRALGAALTVTTLLVRAAPVAGETIVGRDARTAVALTVYSGQDLALVRESRTVDLESGESTLRFEDVPARLDARTTILTAEPAGDGFAVLEQSYLFDLSSRQALQERWIGRDLPEGTWRVYQADAAGGRQLVGEEHLRQTSKDETVEVGLGNATDLIATRTQTDFKKIDIEPFDSESAYEVTLRNEKPAAVTIAVRDRIDGDWQVMESSVPARKADAQTLAFDVPVPAKGQTVLRYRVRVGR